MMTERFENSSFGPVFESHIADELSQIHSHSKSQKYDKKKKDIQTGYLKIQREMKTKLVKTTERP